VKNDHGLLFKKLNELNVSHRVIMTGVSVLSFWTSAIYVFLHKFVDAVEQQYPGAIQSHELPRSERVGGS
jgi:hypothetical protein